MADEPSHEARLVRIAAVERALVAARARGNSGNPRADLARRVKRLEKTVAGLERQAERGLAPPRNRLVNNAVAGGIALGGLLAVLLGASLQLRLLSTKARWVETTCQVVDYGDDGPVALPKRDGAPRFAAPDLPPAGHRTRCFVPDVPLIEGIGRISPPARDELSARDKVRKAYMLLVIEGFAAFAFLCWIAIRKPAEE